MPDKPSSPDERISEALVEAIVKIVGAVSSGVGTAASVGQSTGGAQGSGGGTSAQAGLSAQAAASDVSNKVDVSAPEVIEGLNVHSLKDATLVNKTLVSQAQSNAKLYDVTASALGFAVLAAGANMHQQQAQQCRHGDLAANNQWVNCDKTG